MRSGIVVIAIFGSFVQVYYSRMQLSGAHRAQVLLLGLTPHMVSGNSGEKVCAQLFGALLTLWECPSSNLGMGWEQAVVREDVGMLLKKIVGRSGSFCFAMWLGSMRFALFLLQSLQAFQDTRGLRFQPRSWHVSSQRPRLRLATSATISKCRFCGRP